MSSNFTKALCASVAEEWWRKEAIRTAEALDQLARDRMFESTWGSGRQSVSPLGGVARPAAETQKETQR
jgi:hypothetical protein